MASLRYFLAVSDHPTARFVRRTYRASQRFSLPAPRVMIMPMLWVFLACRSIFHFLKRTLICEPLFKAYCTQYGKGLKTGAFIHYIQGRGELIVGDNVTIDGKIGLNFAARFTPRPRLSIGSNTIVSHRCAIVVGKSVSIGSNCLIGSDVWIFDSGGHPSDPALRLRGDPPSDADVRPVTIGNNVWIGRRSVIYPGVTVGDNSVVAAASIVLADVPPNTMVAGNPARRFAMLPPPTTRTNDGPEPMKTQYSPTSETVA